MGWCLLCDSTQCHRGYNVDGIRICAVCQGYAGRWPLRANGYTVSVAAFAAANYTHKPPR